MYKIGFSSLLLLILLSFSSCEKTEDSYEKPIPPTLILGHKATGSGISSNGLVENSFEAIKYGLNHLDGVEIDVEMSKDSTFWITHNPKITTCDNKEVPVFSLTDSELYEINECRNGTLVTLEEVFEYLSKSSYLSNEKCLSLDMKAVSNHYCTIDNKNEIIANKIVDLYNKTNPKVKIVIESWSYEFLLLLKEKTNTLETFFLVWDNLSKTLIKKVSKDGLAGISCREKILNREMVEFARNKGLKVQVWTVNAEQDINFFLELKPFSIQTDNIDFFLKD